MNHPAGPPEAVSVLERARHPGVAQLRGVEPHGHSRTGLHLGPPAPWRLGEASLTVSEAAGVAISLATTVADLHDVGVAHGALDEASVGLSADGMPVLDGLGAATPLEGPAQSWPARPRARVDDRALGRIAQGLLRRALSALDAGAVAGSRPITGRRRQAEDRAAGKRALAVAEAAAKGRLPARALAAALDAAVPAAYLPLMDRWPVPQGVRMLGQITPVPQGVRVLGQTTPVPQGVRVLAQTTPVPAPAGGPGDRALDTWLRAVSVAQARVARPPLVTSRRRPQPPPQP